MALELVLFYTTADFCARAFAAGITTFVVDFEQRGKAERQRGFNTQINVHHLSDLVHLRRAVPGHIICRIDGWHDDSPDEIQRVIAHGADEILLPMVRSAAEVEAALTVIGERCRLSIMLETVAAVQHAHDFVVFPLRRIYVGLNDLHIERHRPNLFYPLVDGTLDAVFAALGAFSLSFAGLTMPGGGFPLPADMLIKELVRRRAAFGVLRRSFLRDVSGRDLAVEVSRLREALHAAEQRSAQQQADDYAALRRAISALPDVWE